MPAATIPPTITLVLGGTMRRTVVLLAAVCLALAGCSSGSGEPAKTVTATVTESPSLSAAEARAACVDAWSTALQADADADVEDPPAECETVPEGEQLDVYVEGMQERNRVNRGG